MTKQRIHANCRRRTFTLVEMIVAMGVLSILTALLFTVLNETTRVTSQTMGRTRVYTDIRVVVDQMSRELQQAVTDPTRECFWATNQGGTNRMHWLATIDNNTGNEDVEVGYFYDPVTHTLKKTLQFYLTNGFTNIYFDSPGSSTWYDGANGPAITTTQYVPVLDGLKSCTFSFTTNSNIPGAWTTNWSYRGMGTGKTNLPTYVQIVIEIYDPQDVIRYRNDYTALASARLHRSFTNIVYLPRQL